MCPCTLASDRHGVEETEHPLTNKNLPTPRGKQERFVRLRGNEWSHRDKIENVVAAAIAGNNICDNNSKSNES